MTRVLSCVVIATCFLVACAKGGPDEQPDLGALIDGGNVDTGTPPMDSGGVDSGMPPMDSGGVDTGVPMDTGTPVDTGTPMDTGTPVDTGTPIDAGARRALSFTAISTSAPDIVGPGRGLEDWIGNWVVANPSAGSPYNTLDRYHRFLWANMQTGASTFDFTEFDGVMNQAIDRRQKVSFGIMPVAHGGEDVLGYPAFLHSQMQAELVPDWQYEGYWVPNWNSTNYINALNGLLQGLATHINSTSYGGVAYSHVISSIEMRGYGDYGDWTDNPWTSSMPTGTRATAATLDAVISAHVDAFPNFQLQAMVAGFDSGGDAHTPASVMYRLATGSNAHGRFGWRKDSWGAPESSWFDTIDRNTVTYMGTAMADVIPNIWRFAPVTGEPYNCCTMTGGSSLYWDLPRQARDYHLSRLGNGKFESASTAVQNNARAASRNMGYRLVLDRGEISATITRGTPFSIMLAWHNVGVAPTYEEWDIVYELRNMTSGAVLWSSNSSFELRLFLPSDTATEVIDTLTIPTSVASGTYSLVAVVRDPTDYRAPLPLAITGRDSTGAYPLTTITID